jgi:hypothetical protein
MEGLRRGVETTILIVWGSALSRASRPWKQKGVRRMKAAVFSEVGEPLEINSIDDPRPIPTAPLNKEPPCTTD